ncbi:MAG TPA: TIGR01841 family phasin [Stellaceae bacterium]|nr:TIGR01841 family phasin [Stellaceae bacterium]
MANPVPGAEWLQDFGKAFGDMRAPTVDLETVVAMQRKNIEALTQANQLALEGAQAVLRHQLEIARRTMEEFSEMFTSLFVPNGSMEERVAKQTEFSKSALEKGMINAREVTDLMTKANTEAFNVLSRRVAESLEEMKDIAKKRANGGV